MDDKIYFIRDNEQQIPVYDFIKAMDPGCSDKSDS